MKTIKYLFFIVLMIFSLTVKADFTVYTDKNLNAQAIIMGDGLDSKNWCDSTIKLNLTKTDGTFLNRDDLNVFGEAALNLISYDCPMLQKAMIYASGKLVGQEVLQGTNWIYSKLEEPIQSPIAQAQQPTPHQEFTQTPQNDTVYQHTSSHVTPLEQRADHRVEFFSIMFTYTILMIIYFLIESKIKSEQRNKKSKRIVWMAMLLSSIGIALNYFAGDFFNIRLDINHIFASFYSSILIASGYALFIWALALKDTTEYRKITNDEGLTPEENLRNAYSFMMEDGKSMGINMDLVSLHISNDQNTVNAYAVTNYEGKSAILIYPRLVEIMSSDELRAIIAHELGHIKNQDSSAMTLVIMTKLAIDRVVMLPLSAIKYAFSLLKASGITLLQNMNNTGLFIALMLLFTSLMLLGYAGILVAVFMIPGLLFDTYFNVKAFEHSRQREYLADDITKSLGIQNHLADALIKLEYTEFPVNLNEQQAKAIYSRAKDISTHSASILGVESVASDSWFSPSKYYRKYKPKLFLTHPEASERLKNIRD